MFCSNCLTERCISIPRIGLKIDLSLGLRSRPLWSPSPLFFSRQEGFSTWGRRTIVAQPGKSGSSSSSAAVKSKNSIWRRDTHDSSQQTTVDKVPEKSNDSIAESRRKVSAPTRHSGGAPYFSEKTAKPQVYISKGNSFGDSYIESSSSAKVDSFARVSNNVTSYRHASAEFAWAEDSRHDTRDSRQSYGRSYSSLTLERSQNTPPKHEQQQQVLETTVQGRKTQAASSPTSGLDEMNGQVGSLKRPNDDHSAGSNSRRRKKKKYAAESEFRRNLDMCSKYGDLVFALDLYDRVVKEGAIKLDQYAYNVLLYLCSSAALGALKAGKSANDRVNVGKEAVVKNGPVVHISRVDQDFVDGGEAKHTWYLTEVTDEIKLTAQTRGFEIYKHMQSAGVTAGEPTLTSVARLAVAVEDGDLAFEVIKEMSARNIAPKLRSYGPALFTYCKLRRVEKAFEVYAHMNEAGVQPEEDELRALLELSVSSGLEDKVYLILHRLRRSLRDLSRATVEVFHQWFTAKGSEQVGKSKWHRLPSIDDIRRGIESGGGGWHGLGWLGKGMWRAEYTTIDKTGSCRCCNEQLVTIDIDPRETDSFAESLAAIALSREARADFKSFQVWLDSHGPYDAIVDAANVGLLNQNFIEGGFNFVQVNAVVNGIQRLSPSRKLPLIVLHHKRTKGGAAATPTAQQFLQAWRHADTIFTTPTGSNDDWYWLYAAVKYKCLLVTNDEMRDHLFQLLGNDFFPKWKERHQVRFSISKKNDVEFHMPPPYSIVIQESETGAYHIPASGGDDIETPREWLCVSRPGTVESESVSQLLLGQTELEDGMVGSVAILGDPHQPEIKGEKEGIAEQSRVQDGEVQRAAGEKEDSISALQIELLESSSVGASSKEEQTPEVKPSRKSKSPRSPRTPKSTTEGSAAPQATKPEVPKTASPRTKNKKAFESSTLKLIQLADKKAGSAVDFQI